MPSVIKKSRAFYHEILCEQPDRLESLLCILDRRRRIVLESTFGIGMDAISLSALSREWRLSTSRVNQLYHQAIYKIRKELGIVPPGVKSP